VKCHWLDLPVPQPELHLRARPSVAKRWHNFGITKPGSGRGDNAQPTGDRRGRTSRRPSWFLPTAFRREAFVSNAVHYHSVYDRW
jgi:hypothetical protein